jgi:ABC-type transport system involved in multi-copper enzyme maturation permease subunit
MLQLLKIEWLKVKNYRTFWILSALYLSSIAGINYIVYAIQYKIYHDQKTGDIANMFLGGPPFAFPKVWIMTSYVSSYLLFIAGLIMIISVTNEFSFKTHRQNIIDGVTRTEFIVTKLICGLIVALASTVFVFLTGMVFGITEASNSFSFENTVYLFYFFLNALSYCWLAILVALLFKRSGISLGVFFLYTIILENVLMRILNYYFDNWGSYLPIQSSDDLLPLPIFEKIQQQISDTTVNVPLQLVLVLIYLTVYFFISKRKFETADL